VLRGGGGRIDRQKRIRELQAYGVARIYSPRRPEDGLQGMIKRHARALRRVLSQRSPKDLEANKIRRPRRAWRDSSLPSARTAPKKLRETMLKARDALPCITAQA